MARYTLSGLVSDLSGKVGGEVYYRHRGQLLSRAFKKPINRNTSFQITVRTSWRTLRTSWGVISDEARSSWAFAAAQIWWVNPLGTRYHPTAQQLYLQCNSNLIASGLTALTSFVSPAAYKEISNPVFYYSDPVAICFGVQFTGQTTPSNIRYLIYASPGMSAGRSYGEKYLRLIDHIAAGTSDEYDFTAAYLARFSVPAVGERVFFKLKPVETNSGLSGIEARFNTIYTHSGTPPFNPLDIAGCQLWLDAGQDVIKDGDSLVSVWPDKSGNGNNATQSVPANKPLWVASVLNGKPIIRFTGYPVLLRFPDIRLTDCTIFIVYKNTANGDLISGEFNYIQDNISDLDNTNFYWMSYSSNSHYGVWQASPQGIFKITSIKQSGSTSEIIINGAALSLISAHGQPINPVLNCIGTGGSFGSVQADIAEILFYNSALLNADRDKVIAYLAAKYGL